jgi:hypothetical protein
MMKSFFISGILFLILVVISVAAGKIPCGRTALLTQIPAYNYIYRTEPVRRHAAELKKPKGVPARWPQLPICASMLN